MKRKQKPKDKITQLDTIKSVRRNIGKPTHVHGPTKKEKHKWDWTEELDWGVDEHDDIDAQSHKPGDYK